MICTSITGAGGYLSCLWLDEMSRIMFLVWLHVLMSELSVTRYVYMYIVYLIYSIETDDGAWIPQVSRSPRSPGMMLVYLISCVHSTRGLNWLMLHLIRLVLEDSKVLVTYCHIYI